jgi:hypothetical protein
MTDLIFKIREKEHIRVDQNKKVAANSETKEGFET